MAKTKGLPSGSVYPRGTIYWLKYYVPGNAKPIRISSGTSDREAAVSLLRQKMARVSLQLEHTNDPDRVRVSQLLDLLIDDYKYEERASAKDSELRVEKHLRPHFGHIVAKDLGTSQLRDYVKMRRKAGAQQATINKELAFLRRAFRLGYRHEPRLVLNVPYFPIKAVDNAREGVVKPDQYQKILELLPGYARVALVIAYHTGARRGEIRQIKVDRVRLDEGVIELARKTTKGTTERRQGRDLPIYGDMRPELERYLDQIDPDCPYLIQRFGAPVQTFYKVWRKACKDAGMPSALFHDLRRTAVTNMIDAGFSESDAMDVSGHKTTSVFRRYQIKSKERTKKLGERLEEFNKGKKAG
jgi:integrase